MLLTDGIYTATTSGSPQFRFDIRVDLVGAGAAQFSQISGDLFRIDGTRPTFLGSFFATQIDQKSGGERIRARVKYYNRDEFADLVLTKVTDGTSTSIHATYRRIDPAGLATPPLALGLTQVLSGFVRDIAIQVDRDEGTEPPSTASLGSMTVSVQSALGTAGVRLTSAPVSNVFRPSVDAWSVPSLHAALDRFFSLPREGITPDVYLLVATSLLGEPDTTGFMFDLQERRGAAVFYTTMRAKAGGDDEFFRRSFIRTVVHELGHTLNLPHAFAANSLADLGAADPTFMNYPQMFAGPGSGSSVQRYWAAFQFRFSQKEMLQIRHGPLGEVVMGGGPFLSGGPDTMDIASEGDSADGGLRLKIRLRPEPESNIVAFGSPVFVEVKLENHTGEDKPVHRVIEPEYSLTRYLIRKPDNTVITFRNVYELALEHVSDVLPAERPYHWGNVCLSYGHDGFTFIEPGRYEIQAVYPTAAGPVTSNVLRLWVRYPTNAEENLVVPTFERQVGLYLALGGGPHLTKATRLLDEFSDRCSHPGKNKKSILHPLDYSYRRCQALTSVDGFTEVDYATRSTRQLIPPKPDASMLEKSLGPFMAGRDPGSFPLGNIMWGELTGQLGRAYEGAGEMALRKDLMTKAVTYLESQGMPGWALRDYLTEWANDLVDQLGRDSSDASLAQPTSRRPRRTSAPRPSRRRAK